MTFEEFWPQYLKMHSRRETRLMHAVATLSCIGLVGAAIVTRNPWLALAGPIVDYAIAQTSHRLFEKNKTRPWTNQLFHTRAELRMLWRTISASKASC